jgi:hypothetical protein
MALDAAGLAAMTAVADGGLATYERAVRLSAGGATGLWALSIAVAALRSRLDRVARRRAWAAALANGAMAAAWAAGPAEGSAAATVQRVFALAAFASVPWLLWRLARRPARPRSAPAHEYRLVTRWRVAAAPEELCAVFLDTASLSRWWRAAFLEVSLRRGGDATGAARAFRLHTKGWLPYTMRLDAEIVRCEAHRGFTVRTCGDFEGRCVARVRPDGTGAAIRFDWLLRTHKPLLRRLSWCLKPLFAWNHRWVMRRGREGLLSELGRRRAAPGRDPSVSIAFRTPRPTFPYDARRRVARRRFRGLARRVRNGAHAASS